MSEHKRFVWLLGANVSRKGTKLVQGVEYDIETEGAHVVAEWVKTGAAEYVGAHKSKKGQE